MNRCKRQLTIATTTFDSFVEALAHATPAQSLQLMDGGIAWLRDGNCNCIPPEGEGSTEPKVVQRLREHANMDKRLNTIVKSGFLKVQFLFLIVCCVSAMHAFGQLNGILKVSGGASFPLGLFGDQGSSLESGSARTGYFISVDVMPRLASHVNLVLSGTYSRHGLHSVSDPFDTPIAKWLSGYLNTTVTEDQPVETGFWRTIWLLDSLSAATEHEPKCVQTSRCSTAIGRR